MAKSHTATILVTDLVGSTEQRVRLGEERADELRRTHDELLRAAVVSNGGSVVKGLGDGVLAMFDSASDGVSAAVTVQQAAYAHTRVVPDEPLEIRVGLSAGDVTLEEGDVFGTPVVEASRLCGAALGGQILAAELVRLLARGRGGHTFTAAGDRELKGLPDPVAVAIVGWEPPGLADAPAVPFPVRLSPHAPLPFSGRGPELESVVHAWKEASAGDRRVVLVSGEPGIGKTRLAAEAARVAHDGGATVVYGRCDEDMGVPFQPFVEALAQIVQAEPSADRLGRHAGELVRLVPDLARVVPGLETPLSSDPETERYRFFDAVAAWFGAMSQPRGVVLVLDDLHWAEKPTLLLLRHLIRSPEPMRLLVIGTYRDTDLARTHPLAEMLADLRRERGVERLPLTGLDVSGINDLLSSASGERMDLRAGELAQLLWSETEGNPFFVQEILRSLVESGRLVQRDGVWTTDLEVVELGIPEGVREVVGRRLTRLSDTANSVLALASVIGPAFDVELLITVAGLPEDDVFDALDDAVAASLLSENDAGEYEFTHALVRTTLYEEVSAARRARRHRQVAEVLETRRSDDVASLAYHFGRAGAADDRAVDYARGAGDQAVELLAFDQAVTFFRQALDAADDVEASEAVRCDLLVRLGNAQRLAGIRAHRETLLEAAALAQQVGDADLLARAALANHRGLFSMAGQVDEERVTVLEAALAGAGPDDSPTRARLLAVLAQEMTWHDPQQRRFEFADEALAMARRVGDDACLLQVWTARQHSHWVADRLPALVAELPELLALADRVGDAQSRVLASAWGFIHALDLGDIETADRLLARNAEVVAEFNHPSFRWLHANYRCCRMMINGTGDEIEAGATEALRLGQDAGEPDAFIWFAPQLFWAREAQGRLPEIIDLVRQETAANPGLPTWKLVLAYGLVKVGEVDEARKLVEEMTSSGTDPLPYDMLWLLAQVNLGMVLGAVGSPEAAAAQHERLLPYAGRLAAIGTIAQRSVHYALALLAVRAGWADGAEQHFADASAQYEAIGADLWLAEARLAWARLLLARGEVDRARVLLTEARAGAERMAAHHVAAEASALLE